jgi:hypothetical protein
MRLENIKFYRLVCILFIFIIIILAFFNIKSLKIMNLNKSQDKSIENNKPKITKEYGYSEALELLSKVPNLTITNFTNNADNKKLLKVELDYKGDIYSFIKTINDIKEEDNYLNIDNIKIENNNTNNQTIRFDIFLIKNR